MSAEKNIATHLAHAGGKPDQHTGAVVPGIDPATTFARDETYATYALKSASHLYSRDDNDLYRQAEALIARMEGRGNPAVLSSGMAAIAAVFRSVPQGRS